ncbi:unnamed protein product [Trichobilharzia regenti]|uniref:PRESAN domain-containing protein n=1 Tax=Trichobilharzia regenti TaxID=157069 RepID=A0A183VPE6_TRIRE|nr:unnamed protein product [Trichobilharzia regenti]VDP98231.1 unnamed protein product [Trichobilharzia regenti]
MKRSILSSQERKSNTAVSRQSTEADGHQTRTSNITGVGGGISLQQTVDTEDTELTIDDDDDSYAGSMAKNLPEDDDLRVMVELNNPRIYRDVKHILLEEQRIRKALRKNKKLPFPCKCYQLCEFGYLIQPLTSALGQLYEEYISLHRDYHNLFHADTITTDDNQIYVNNTAITVRQKSKETDLNKKYPLNTNEFHYDIEHLIEKIEAQENERLYRRTCEPYMEAVRLYIQKMATPKWERIKLWFKNHLMARKKCICFHCDYRDALIDYRDALINLHKEYIIIYANYYALVNSLSLNELSVKNNKILRKIKINSKYLQYIKSFL